MVLWPRKRMKNLPALSNPPDTVRPSTGILDKLVILSQLVPGALLSLGVCLSPCTNALCLTSNEQS